jgi:hypothetical protein
MARFGAFVLAVASMLSTVALWAPSPAAANWMLPRVFSQPQAEGIASRSIRAGTRSSHGGG